MWVHNIGIAENNKFYKNKMCLLLYWSKNDVLTKVIKGIYTKQTQKKKL